jgi:hypothetical protein
VARFPPFDFGRLHLRLITLYAGNPADRNATPNQKFRHMLK